MQHFQFFGNLGLHCVFVLANAEMTRSSIIAYWQEYFPNSSVLELKQLLLGDLVKAQYTHLTFFTFTDNLSLSGKLKHR